MKQTKLTDSFTWTKTKKANDSTLSADEQQLSGSSCTLLANSKTSLKNDQENNISASNQEEQNQPTPGKNDSKKGKKAAAGRKLNHALSPISARSRSRSSSPASFSVQPKPPKKINSIRDDDDDDLSANGDLMMDVEEPSEPVAKTAVNGESFVEPKPPKMLNESTNMNNQSISSTNVEASSQISMQENSFDDTSNNNTTNQAWVHI